MSEKNTVLSLFGADTALLTRAHHSCLLRNFSWAQCLSSIHTFSVTFFFFCLLTNVLDHKGIMLIIFPWKIISKDVILKFETGEVRGCLSLFCVVKTLTKTKLKRKGFISYYYSKVTVFLSKKLGTCAETFCQELNQRLWENTAYWLTLFAFSCNPQPPAQASTGCRGLCSFVAIII